MAWIDLFLNNGDPHRVFGADAGTVLRQVPRWRDLPWMAKAYRRAGLSWRTVGRFLLLDVIRYSAYRKGFRDGGSFPWPE